MEYYMLENGLRTVMNNKILYCRERREINSKLIML